MTRPTALALTCCLVGCVVHTHETPDSSLTSTTRSTNATAPTPYDPHFRVSDQIYATCQIANRPDMDVAESTAWCLKTGPLNDKHVRIQGSRDEVDHARNRLVGNGVEINRVINVYTDGPASIDVVENTLGKRKR